MFTASALLVGAIGAFIVGMSKTGVPGGGLLAIPLFATVFDGRQIVGATLPILIFADLFAIGWYRHHARWDLLKPLARWVGLGFAFGIVFFVAVGAATRPLEIVIGAIVLVIVAVQLWRMWRQAPVKPATTATAATYGTAGGFTTFVANAAGPVFNTYLAGLGLPKLQLIGTSAWLYLTVNVSKIPFYLALGAWTSGGHFFTSDSLLFDLAVLPATIVGAYAGRAVFHRIPQRAFLVTVLVLSAGGAVKLLL